MIEWETPATSGVGNPVTVNPATAPGELVRVNEAGVVTPATEAVTTYPPAVVLPSRVVSVAWPLAPVVAVVPEGNVTPAPEPGPAKVTVAPETGLPYWSSTSTTRELVNAVPTVADCPPPDTVAMDVAAPAVLVRENETGVEIPVTLAVTGYVPVAVSAFTARLAIPLVPVIAVVPEGKVTPAPEPGPAKVTVTPETGLPY